MTLGRLFLGFENDSPAPPTKGNIQYKMNGTPILFKIFYCIKKIAE